MDLGEKVAVQTSGACLELPKNDSLLRKRNSIARVSKSPSHETFEELVKKTSTLSLKEREGPSRLKFYWRQVVSPLIITCVAAFVRFYGISSNQSVVWDEAHFGKFGAYYIQRELYFDVHPPLGKMLIGLSGYLAGFDGDFKFESGSAFPPGRHFMYMRMFNCVFGVLCTPLAYFTALELDMSMWTTWFVSLSVALEMLSVTLSKFILLDSMLLFFTVSTFFGLCKIHTSAHDKLLTAKGLAWLSLTGVSIGCVCSVKWVGLFVTVLVGIYTVYDLMVKFYQTTVKQPAHHMSLTRYVTHWMARVACLIVIPFAIYVTAFKIHFTVLSRSGTGDGSVSTLLQASLEGNSLTHGPRSVAYGSQITLRSQGLSPNLLHSHSHMYPEGSRQQQITTYGFKDENNDFLVEFGLDTSMTQNRYATLASDSENSNRINDYETLVKDGDTIRLSHKSTKCFLHSHSIAAAVSTRHHEASCYGNLDINDEQDDWVIEVQTQDRSPSELFQNENDDEIHPVSTNFRLRHKATGCYLATTGHAYPAWGFNQGEVVCKYSLFASDKSTWWNIEEHVNDHFVTPDTPYVAPKPKFYKEFVLLNYGMMASNNALVPDPDHYDHLASSWWEWPVLRSGLRMSNWGPGSYRYFLMGHPFVTFFSTFSILAALLTFGGIAIAWQRQKLNLSVFSNEWSFVLSAGLLPLLGYILHYLPFVLMARVTYLHHYVPALYFAIFVSGFLVEFYVARRTPMIAKTILFAVLYACVIGGFCYYSPLAMGMVGGPEKYKHLRLLRSWKL